LMRGEFIFITGGARSGKSSFAEKMAADVEARGVCRCGTNEKEPGTAGVTYVATCAPQDEEMKRRIEKHRKSRLPGWRTVEEGRQAARVIRKEGMCSKVVLLDCLTLLVSNLLLERKYSGEEADGAEKGILAEIERLAEAARDVPATVIVVSNEVGMGIVPDNETGRVYRDILGRANQIMAAKADRVYFMVAGIPVEIKTVSG